MPRCYAGRLVDGPEYGLSKIRVIPADFAADRDAIYAVREIVFIVEQSVPVEIEIDEFDPVAQHVLAYDGDRPVGTGRITAAGPQGRMRRIGRMAVLDAYRGRGVGGAIISALIEIGIAAGCREFVSVRAVSCDTVLRKVRVRRRGADLR